MLMHWLQIHLIMPHKMLWLNRYTDIIIQHVIAALLKVFQPLKLIKCQHYSFILPSGPRKLFIAHIKQTTQLYFKVCGRLRSCKVLLWSFTILKVYYIFIMLIYLLALYQIIFFYYCMFVNFYTIMPSTVWISIAQVTCILQLCLSHIFTHVDDESLGYESQLLQNQSVYPDSKVHGAYMAPAWALSAPDGPHVGPMNLAIRGTLMKHTKQYTTYSFRLIHFR